MTRPVRHIVRRVLLELDSAAPPAEAPRIQARAADLCRRRLASLLDRCLTEFGDPDTLYRIERLECVIPDIDLEQLDAEWTKKVEARIRETLREALRRAGPGGVSTAPGRSDEPADQPAVSGRIPGVSASPGRIRSAAPFDDSTLPRGTIEKLAAGPAMPAAPDGPGEDSLPPNRVGPPAAGPPAFVETYSPGASGFDLLLFFLQTGLLPWWAGTAGNRTVQQAADAVVQTPGWPEMLFQRIAANTLMRRRLIQHTTDAVLITFCHRLAGAHFAAGLERFFAGISRLPGPERRRFWEAVFGETDVPGPAGMPASGAKPRKNKAHWERLYRRMATPEYPGKETDTPPAPATPRFAPDDKQLERPNEPIPDTPDFDDSEHLYIENAGVALIAPYLPRLWEQLDWVTDNRFNDPETAWLAVQMTQFLCDGQPETSPEYLLALPKILCGFRPGALFEPPRPLNEEEMAAGDTLLEAVLEHAPGLGLKTAGALRGSFLLRKGVLRSGDFQWLLHVEKETYDIVLQKVPWAFQALKFPWMEAAVFVEWEV